ncbi:hypothetical protein BEWA_048650 [Theileria equi strain WA]|uniref:Uncharacterized protein n=1 Tax=Theileria equi strain WA TaxID=1537102 RepID=L1LB68_THEEQ|nr:hypothetical protein BEWA_048650 [Theileria equi strain WA]EKX72398.1 hypothetical protein BEWA_048650 [Theileria equi strain WA]|eukprot:XP_004831850.1 hypothetical protein BEWA_048650 [Theileria equi strain WA]
MDLESEGSCMSLTAKPTLAEEEIDLTFSGLCDELERETGEQYSRNQVISYIVVMVNGILVLINLPVTYIYKDDFNIPPGTFDE